LLPVLHAANPPLGGRVPFVAVCNKVAKSTGFNVTCTPTSFSISATAGVISSKLWP
jgi:hypothetical protein